MGKENPPGFLSATGILLGKENPPWVLSATGILLGKDSGIDNSCGEQYDRPLLPQLLSNPGRDRQRIKGVGNTLKVSWGVRIFHLTLATIATSDIGH